MTTSERILTSLLEQVNVNFKKIPESDIKTPDFELKFTDHTSYWEVKELIENPAEKQILSQIKDNSLQIYKINSERVWSSIKTAAKQLKNYGESTASRVIVLCDNRDFATMDFMFIQRIQEAILGSAEYFVHGDGTFEEIKRHDGLFTNRMQYISAVAVLAINTGKIQFFHNPNAQISLIETNLMKCFDKHYVFVKKEKYNNWERL